MKNSPIFSIIIPIYNVEKYLKQCIDSVLNQNFKLYEVILVDDGSPDNSGIICDEYANKFKHIKVIHKKNGGLSDARNAGIEIASGEYLIFLDSDDYWWDKPVLEPLYELISKGKPDIILHGHSNIYPNKIYERKYTHEIINADLNNDLENLLKDNIYDSTSWNKIVKRSIVINNKIIFPKGILHEDNPWCFDIANISKTYSILPYSFYQYRLGREGAITSNITQKHINDIQLTLKNKISILNNGNCNQSLGFYLFSIYIIMLERAYQANIKLKDLQEFEYALLPYSKIGRFSSLRVILYRILGVNNSIKLISKLKKVLKNDL